MDTQLHFLVTLVLGPPIIVLLIVGAFVAASRWPGPVVYPLEPDVPAPLPPRPSVQITRPTLVVGRAGHDKG